MNPVFSDKISLKSLGIILAIVIIPFSLFHVLVSTDYKILLYFNLLMFTLIGLLAFLKISFSFSENFLQFSCFPFIKNKQILYSNIKKVEIENSSFGKYGGLGIRLIGNGTAYVMGNEKNLVLHLTNNKQIVLSFREVDEENVAQELHKHNISFTKTPY